MRTTISIDERLGRAAKERAAREGLSLSAFIARAIQTALAETAHADAIPPFELVTVSGGGPRPGVDLDRTSSLLERDDIERHGR